MTRIEELTSATATLAVKLDAEVRRRRMAERTLTHESNALHEAFREIEALKAENKALRKEATSICDAADEAETQVADMRPQLERAKYLLGTIQLAASHFPIEYRKQIQAILEAK